MSASRQENAMSEVDREHSRVFHGMVSRILEDLETEVKSNIQHHAAGPDLLAWCWLWLDTVFDGEMRRVRAVEDAGLSALVLAGDPRPMDAITTALFEKGVTSVVASFLGETDPEENPGGKS